MPTGGENQAYGLGSGQPPAEAFPGARKIADLLQQGSADATALRGVQQTLLGLYPLEPETASAGMLADLVADELPRLRAQHEKLAQFIVDHFPVRNDWPEDATDAAIMLLENLDKVWDEALRQRAAFVDSKVSTWIRKQGGVASAAALDAMRQQVTEVWNHEHPALAQLIDGGRA